MGGSRDAGRTAAALVIGGRRTFGGSDDYPVNNPARPGEVVVDAPAASFAQLDEAVEAARAAAPPWAATTPRDRADALIAAGEAAAAGAASDDLARLLTREHGKVLAEATFDVATASMIPAAFAELAVEALESRTTGEGSGASEITYEPFGVVAAILPFNWPVSVMSTKVVPALLAGNAVVVKVPPTCPAATLEVAATMAEVLPAGVLNALGAPGPELGEALVTHDGVGMVSFTGGVGTGRAVMAAAATGPRPVLLELGGNDAAIVAPDVEIDDALARRLFDAAFLTAGQVCMAIKRLYVPDPVVRDVVDALAGIANQVVVGDGLADEVTMGPVHTAAARERVEHLLDAASTAGATIYRPASIRDADRDAGGHFVSPAIVEGAPDAAGIVREEQFAPALPVLGYSDLDDAVRRANDTEFGLCASVWSHDAGLAAALARRLEAGVVFVNDHGTTAVDHRAPFGGWNRSGVGRELGAEGVLAYTRTRSLTRHTLP